MILIKENKDNIYQRLWF